MGNYYPELKVEINGFIAMNKYITINN